VLESTLFLAYLQVLCGDRVNRPAVTVSKVQLTVALAAGHVSDVDKPWNTKLLMM